MSSGGGEEDSGGEEDEEHIEGAEREELEEDMVEE